eukprot:m.498890 g.498890  ORF g.498890 m.498890 type:complete len:163 (+) comp55666_c0_seq1:1054-1542(+)
MSVRLEFDPTNPPTETVSDVVVALVTRAAVASTLLALARDLQVDELDGPKQRDGITVGLWLAFLARMGKDEPALSKQLEPCTSAEDYMGLTLTLGTTTAVIGRACGVFVRNAVIGKISGSMGTILQEDIDRAVRDFVLVHKMSENRPHTWPPLQPPRNKAVP